MEAIADVLRERNLPASQFCDGSGGCDACNDENQYDVWNTNFAKEDKGPVGFGVAEFHPFRQSEDSETLDSETLDSETLSSRAPISNINNILLNQDNIKLKNTVTSNCKLPDKDSNESLSSDVEKNDQLALLDLSAVKCAQKTHRAQKTREARAEAMRDPKRIAAYRLLDAAWPEVAAARDFALTQKQWRDRNLAGALAAVEVGIEPDELAGMFRIAHKHECWRGLTRIDTLCDKFPSIRNYHEQQKSLGRGGGRGGGKPRLDAWGAQHLK